MSLRFEYMLKRLWALAGWVFLSMIVSAQPSEYSLFRQAAAWLNPALTGTGLEVWKFSGLNQWKTVNDTLSHRNLLVSAEYRLDFSKTSKNYGLVVERRHPLALSLGLLGERRFSSHIWYPFQRTGLAINAMLFSEASLHLLALSLRPVFYEAAAYTPVATVKVSPFADSLMPGHSRERLFTADAGLLLGLGKMDCWADDQAYRFEVGMSVLNITMAQQAHRPDVHPGREYHLHAGSLIELSREWGCVVRGMFMNDGESFAQGGFTLLYRRHWSVADRLRAGIAYRDSGHLSLSGGFRMYGTSRQTFSADIELSHDFPLKGRQKLWPWHIKSWEISLIIKPLKKCWGMDNCTGSYQFETN